METTNCHVCGEIHWRAFLEREDRFSGETFQYVKCTNCGLIYLNPRPSLQEISAYYPDEYEAHQTDDNGRSFEQRWHKNRALDRQIKFVESYSNEPGVLLDVGSATGEFMLTALERGWRVKGVELVESAAGYAKEVHQLDVVVGTLESTGLPPNHFDVVTMWDVLEHLPDPSSSMRHIHRLLKPGGLVIFSIPNLESMDRYLFGKNWIGWDAPRHYALFEGRHLDTVFRDTGFEFIDRRCITGAKGAFLLNLDFILRDKPGSPLAKTLYPLVSIMLWPYRQLAYLLDKAPIITYVAQKSLPSKA